MNHLASQQWVNFQKADSEILVQWWVNVRVCGICCNIKGEAVEDVRRGGIWPKQEVDRYIMKDGYDKWDKEAFMKAREEVVSVCNIWRVENWMRILTTWVKKYLTGIVQKGWEWDPLQVRGDNDSLNIWVDGSAVVILLAVIGKSIVRSVQEECVKVLFVQTMPSQASIWAHRYTLEALALAPYF